MPEVAGDGALFVDPYDVKGFNAALERVVLDQELREKLIAKGFENSGKFSWNETASE